MTLAGLSCIAPAAAALAMLPLRTVVPNADAAIAVVAVVALAAVVANRWTSAIGAAGGAATFALFWAEPEGSLQVEQPADRLTSVVVFVVGLVLAEVVRRGHGAVRSAKPHRWSWRWGRRRPLESLRSVGRVAQEVAEGDDAEFIVLDVARSLVELLELSDCRYESAPLTGTPRATLVHSGELELGEQRWSPTLLALPGSGFDLVLAARGQTMGRFVCTPRGQHTVTEDRILAALTLVDQAASARLIAAVS